MAAFVATFAGYAIYHLAWQPFGCDAVKAQVQRAALREWDRPRVLAQAAEARARIEQMEKCIAICVTDIDMFMTLAINDRLIGRAEHAAAVYRLALRYDRRPELFFNLGMVQLEMHQREAAVLSLANAVAFEENYANEIVDPTIRDEVFTAARMIRPKPIRRSVSR